MAFMREERVSSSSSGESVLSEDLHEVTVAGDSGGEEQVLLPIGSALRNDRTSQSVSSVHYIVY